MTAYADGCPRVYTRTGKTAHLLPPLASPRTCLLALCGTGPEWSGTWRGTGSQAEYETVASLPVCRRCEKQARAEDEAATKLAAMRGGEPGQVPSSPPPGGDAA